MTLLPLSKNPIIKTYQYNAYVNELLADDPKGFSWMMGNYIQLMLRKSDFYFYFSVGTIYGGIPLIENKPIDPPDFDVITSSEALLHQTIRESIENGFYCYTFVDDFYVPYRFPYQKFHTIHDVLVYGYDLETQVYQVIGYDRDAIYKRNQLDFDTLYKAFAKEAGCITMFKKKDQAIFQFNIHNVSQMLHDYLNSISWMNHQELYFDFSNYYNKLYLEEYCNQDWVYGISLYEELIRWCNLLEANDNRIDILPFYGLFEHKQCMLLRLKYLHENNFIRQYDDLSNSFQQLQKGSKDLYNLALKYNVKKDKRILQTQIQPMITELQHVDRTATEMLLQEITDCNQLSYT